jgi:hypothetical protein
MVEVCASLEFMSDNLNLQSFTPEELQALKEVVKVTSMVMEEQEMTEKKLNPEYLRLKTILEKLDDQKNREPITALRPNRLIIGDEGSLHLVRLDYWALLAEDSVAAFVWFAETLAKDAPAALALALAVFQQELTEQESEVVKVWGLRANVELANDDLRQHLKELLS